MSELRLERTYAVTPNELFDLVTLPENLIQWWGPEGTTATEAYLDLRRVGPWTLVLQSPRGPFTMKGEVLSVTRPRMVEFTMNVPGDETESIVRFEITLNDSGGSRLTLIQSGITDAMVEMGKRGWGSTLARLEKLVASIGT